MCPARYQKRLLVRKIENLKAKNMDEHPILGIYQIESVDHSFIVEQATISSQNAGRRVRKFLIKAQMHIDK